MKLGSVKTHRGLMLILVAVIAVLLSVTAFAEEEHGAVIDSGECGDNLTYTVYEDGLLEIGGRGAMWDYENDELCCSPWYEYRETITNISFCNGVTHIGAYSLGKNNWFDASVLYPNLTGELILPDSILSIGEYAFAGCVGFTGGLVIPDYVEIIKEGAFAGCTGFTGDLKIGDGVISIGDAAFRCCTGFCGGLKLGKSIKTIGNDAFNGVFFMRGLTTPMSFTGNLYLPDNLEVIGESAFTYCASFTGELIIPDKVTSIEAEAFSFCSGFTLGLILPESITNIDAYAFYGCSGFTGSVTISENVTKIGDYAFSGCTGLDAAIFTGPALSEIGIDAFRPCAPGFMIYCMCDYLESFTSHNSYDASSGCTWAGYPLEILDDPDEKSGRCGENLTWTLYRDGKLRISGTGSMYDYEYHEAPWYLFRYSLKTLEMENGITRVGTNAFTDCNKLTGDLDLPEGLLSIGDSAFTGCLFTGSLRIPNKVTVIGDEAFFGCGGFDGDLVFSDSLTLIGQSAFRDCDGLTGNLSLPESLLRIRDKAFYNCTCTNAATFNGNVPMMGENVFDGCADGFTVYCYQKYASSFTTIDGRWNGYPLKIIDEGVTPEITMSLTGATLDVGSTIQFAANVTGDMADEGVVWTSSDDKVASVDNGTVTALAEGTAMITATARAGGKPVSFEVKINPAPAPIIRGDIDGDGLITAKDRVLLSRYLAGWQGYTQFFER